MGRKMKTYRLATTVLLLLSAPAAFAENLSVVEQIGTVRSVTLAQARLRDDATNDSTIRQDGTGHKVSVDQQSWAVSTVTIEQTGTSQHAQVRQTSDPTSSNGVIRQSGDSNRAILWQSGDGESGAPQFTE